MPFISRPVIEQIHFDLFIALNSSVIADAVSLLVVSLLLGFSVKSNSFTSYIMIKIIIRRKNNIYIYNIHPYPLFYWALGMIWVSTQYPYSKYLTHMAIYPIIIPKYTIFLGIQPKYPKILSIWI